MKVCETCGKILNDSTEEFTINGVLQCEECAYPKRQATQKSTENLNLNSNKNIRYHNGWSSTLSTIGKINIVMGSVISFILGLSMLFIIDETYSLFMCIGTVILGVVLSVVSSSLLMTFAEIGDNISVIRHIEENKNN